MLFLLFIVCKSQLQCILHKHSVEAPTSWWHCTFQQISRTLADR